MSVVSCECGFEAAGATDDDLVAAAQGHARHVHGREVAADLVLALARPLQRPTRKPPNSRTGPS